MRDPEKNTESFIQTVKRTIITTTIIAVILFCFRIFPSGGKTNIAAFATIWTAVFCIVFGGHWLELLFINHIKFVLPKNMLFLYFVRICYWFLSAVLLFAVATLANNLLSQRAGYLGGWWIFGLIYIGIQLVMYAIMHIRFKKSFYNGVY